MIKNSGVVPMIGAALSNPSYCAGASPITRGAIRLILSILDKLCASSMVSGLGESPAKAAGEPPPEVSFRPGMTINRLVPRLLNSPVI